MDERRVEALFTRWVENRVLHGTGLDLEELAQGDAELAAALRERIVLLENIEHELHRSLEPLTGQQSPRYRFHEMLGQGGMGEVYRAEDLELGREVAVKVLPPLLAADPERAARFAREGRLLASLEHPNIAAVFGLERWEGLELLIMELVPGETLAERLERGALPAGEAIALCRQIALALEAASGVRPTCGPSMFERSARCFLRSVSGRTPNWALFTPDERQLWITCYHSCEVIVVDTDPESPTLHTLLARLPFEGRPTQLVFVPAAPGSRR